MITNTFISLHWWPRTLVLVAIIGPGAWQWVAEAYDDNSIDEWSVPSFPGKATWGTSKDVFGPISISTGSSKRSERSVLKATTVVQDERRQHNIPNEDQVGLRWEGRALPLVTEGEATVVSASLSIGGGEAEVEDQGDLEYTRPRVVRPRPPFQRRPQPRFPWMLWRGRGPANARQQLSKTIQNTRGKLEVFRAGLKGDSPFVYTLSSPNPNQSSRSARVYNFREEHQQNVHDDTTTDEHQQNISEDNDKEEEGTKSMSNQQDSTLGGEYINSESTKQKVKTLTEDIEEILNSSDQKVVLVEKRQVDRTATLKDTQNQQGSSESNLQANETLPEDTGVDTAIYINPSNEDKFRVYFEEERTTNASNLSPPSKQQHDAPNSQSSSSSSRYSNVPQFPIRPIYIIVKEDPRHHLPGGFNEVDSPDAVPRYRVQKVPGINTTEQTYANSEGLVNTTGVKYEQSENNQDSTSSYPTHPRDSFISSSTYDPEEIIPEPPEEEINEIHYTELVEPQGDSSSRENYRNRDYNEPQQYSRRGHNEEHNRSYAENQNKIPAEQGENRGHYEEQQQNNVHTNKYRLSENVIDPSRNVMPGRRAPTLSWNPIDTGTPSLSGAPINTRTPNPTRTPYPSRTPYPTRTPSRSRGTNPSWTPSSPSSTFSSSPSRSPFPSLRSPNPSRSTSPPTTPPSTVWLSIVHTPHPSQLQRRRDTLQEHPKALRLSIGEGKQQEISSGSVREVPLLTPGCVVVPLLLLWLVFDLLH
ncbi:hypothetical protein Pmani_029254 [Petrolisthes manimaculis]|uniref:Uncharacterized protein n=1 Tax=Petrolisthes manimaculis TaxID=1843537 RepID=A0AAE1NZP0_9EUCA|nr:hypothetical protein Pmani_029254 [Petrolisthes manimaculis]